ncbi:MAG: type II toxin-antitoxin system VapC family toxin [Actinobacteria bacterium]|nr:type II toxin-antitoxin system VapC family toxin [Actinomycetota bacterium]
MNLLLDTHVLLWWASGSGLDDRAIGVISDPGNLVYVSAASIWEVSVKQALGKLSVDGDLDAMVADEFEPLDIGFVHARVAGELPAHHRDPFDRILIAQGKVDGLTILTRDREFSNYDVSLMQV